MQEQARFLVSASLTLSSAHVSIVDGIRHCDDFPRWPQKKKKSVEESVTGQIASLYDWKITVLSQIIKLVTGVVASSFF